MKDFDLIEAADEAALNFPGIPKDVVRHICQTVIREMTEIVREKKGRIRWQQGCIHTVYYEIVPEEARAALADLDESRCLTPEEALLTAKEKQYARPLLPREVKRDHALNQRIHDPGPYTDKVYPE